MCNAIVSKEKEKISSESGVRDQLRKSEKFKNELKREIVDTSEDITLEKHVEAVKESEGEGGGEEEGEVGDAEEPWSGEVDVE